MQTPSSEYSDEPTSYGRCSEITPNMRRTITQELINRINSSSQNLTALMERRRAGEEIYFVSTGAEWLYDNNKI